MRLKVAWYDGIPARYRPDTTDEKILRGLLTNSSYRKKSLGFDVFSGEKWLDLGANVGAFAIYCKQRDAIAECYEPDPDCFKILERNAPWFVCNRAAVTALHSEHIPFHVSTNKDNHYRGSILTGRCLRLKTVVPNVFIGSIKAKFDGIKMDIEGSEFGILDAELLPSCDKFVMEYHTSRDDSPKNLKRRLEFLHSRFDHIHYPPELDRKMEAGISVKTFQDREIFCWGAK
jgi:FkbM family methyltransferase